MASHDKCAPWPDAVMHLEGQPGRAICWRHPTDWRLDGKVNFFLLQHFGFIIVVKLSENMYSLGYEAMPLASIVSIGNDDVVRC